MCGIFGIFGFQNNCLEKAQSALVSLIHRGPDQAGEWYEPGIYLGHRRLSIIDLSENGKQPMIDNEQKVVLCVNGEIYNYQELKEELIGKYPFKSKSDSEVILYGYKEWGIDKLIERLDGMFTFALYDKRKGILYLCRDRFGKKPLFYSTINNQLIFASEIKALFEYAPSLKVFSKDGIYDWMYHRGNNSKETIYYNISQLSPGHYMICTGDGHKLNKYYDLTDQVGKIINYKNIPEELDSLLNSAVKKRLISDVPVGLQLSGGVDSSLIAHYMKKNHSGEFHSFCIGFSNKEDLRFSEEKYARSIAEKLGIIHHQQNVSKQSVVTNFEHVIQLFDGMLDIPNAIPIYMLCKYSKEYISVVLTGEGADELFGGYEKLTDLLSIEKNRNTYDTFYTNFLINLFGGLQQSKAKQFLRKAFLNNLYAGHPYDILEDTNCYISPQTLSEIFGKRKNSLFDFTLDKRKLATLPFFRQLLLEEHKSYLLFLIDRQDRASMGAAMEARLPFLDRSLVEWAFNLPQEYLFNEKQTKIILKNLSSQLFGYDFTYRPKIGFPLPIHQWLDQEDGFKPWVDKVYSNDFILYEYIKKETLQNFMKSNRFDNKLLCYPDSERMWMKWFFMVIRTTQDLYNITEIK
jgi:asparagine synthase (glutamine-hydrolysing)